MIVFLMKEFSEAPLFIVLTTYIANEERLLRVKERNKAALQIAEKYRLPVIDLYTLSEKAKDLLSHDGVHFTDEGYKLLAGEILKEMEKIKLI